MWIMEMTKTLFLHNMNCEWFLLLVFKVVGVGLQHVKVSVFGMCVFMSLNPWTPPWTSTKTPCLYSLHTCMYVCVYALKVTGFCGKSGRFYYYYEMVHKRFLMKLKWNENTLYGRKYVWVHSCQHTFGLGLVFFLVWAKLLIVLIKGIVNATAHNDI